jgi:hypothetical protein
MEDSCVDLDTLLVCTLGVLCCFIIVAITVVQALGHDPGIALNSTLSAALGALLALARPPKPPMQEKLP